MHIGLSISLRQMVELAAIGDTVVPKAVAALAEAPKVAKALGVEVHRAGCSEVSDVLIRTISPEWKLLVDRFHRGGPRRPAPLVGRWRNNVVRLNGFDDALTWAITVLDRALSMGPIPDHVVQELWRAHFASGPWGQP